MAVALALALAVDRLAVTWLNPYFYRILVLCEGRLTAVIPRLQATEEAIMRAATQFLDRGKSVQATNPAPVRMT